MAVRAQQSAPGFRAISPQTAAPPYYLVMPLFDRRRPRGPNFAAQRALDAATRALDRAGGALPRRWTRRGAGYLPRRRQNLGNLMLSSEGHTVRCWTWVLSRAGRDRLGAGSAGGRRNFTILSARSCSPRRRGPMNAATCIASARCCSSCSRAGRPFASSRSKSSPRHNCTATRPTYKHLHSQLPAAVADIWSAGSCPATMHCAGHDPAVRVVRELIAVEISALAERIPA